MKLLKQSFSDIIDEGYTAELEEKLDEVEDGKLEWTEALRAFSVKFNSDLERAGTEITTVKGTGVDTDDKCEPCGSPCLRFGRFASSWPAHYPECTDHQRDAQKATPRGHVGRRPIICDNMRQDDQLKRAPLRQVLRLPRHPDAAHQ